MSEASSHEDRLSKLDLFTGLSKKQLKKLAERSQVVEHEAGRTIAAEGLGALAFHLILDGEATVSRGGETIRTLGSDDYFGEISIIDGKPRSVSVAASSPLRTLVVPHQVFQNLLDSEPSFARELLTLLCTRVREAEARLGT
jgi:CRP/FNR family cyclic AMP-dependent transcriptional regulator